MGGVVDSRAVLLRALDVLDTWNHPVDAWVFTGDLTDEGDAESYAWLAETVGERAEARGVRVIWANGNHDDRVRFGRLVCGADRPDEPYLAEHRVGGLRILIVDTNVPGYSWGQVAPEPLAWLDARLSEDAPEGTLLVLHHAPLPTVQDAASLWSLRGQDALADVVRGRGVRGILSGHFHQTGFGTFAGVPVGLATSLAYTQDVTTGRTLRGQDASQGFSLVEVYDDCVLHTAVPLTHGKGVHGTLTPEQVARKLGSPS